MNIAKVTTMNKNSEEVLHGNSSGSENLKFPYEIKKIDSDTNKEMLELFSGETIGYVQVGPKNYFLSIKYESNAEEIYNFKVRSDDIWLVTFPRSGSTLTQEMVWLLANNLDYDAAMKTLLLDRFRYLESAIHFNRDVMYQIQERTNLSQENQKVLEQMCVPLTKSLEEQTGKRFIRTHLPFSLLPPNLLTSGCKVIYVARNPKDTMVSFYHFCKLCVFQGYAGDLEQFANLFMEDRVIFLPYWSHLEEAWKLRGSKNFFFMTYEEMNKDIRQSIKKVSKFLGKNVTEKQLEKLENHLQIESFRNNPMVNNDILVDVGIFNKCDERFIRNGKVSSPKDDTDEEYIKKFNEWVKNKNVYIED
ncbi:hypothetical protein FQR65_LT05949 [Abscondita terminalis]|nr:hypothetical protein FQR65_LT05949 [Abscondita terminalis]